MSKVEEIKKSASAQLAGGAGAVLHAVTPVLEERYKDAAARAEHAYGWASPHVREAFDKAIEKLTTLANEYADEPVAQGRETVARTAAKAEGISDSVTANFTDAREKFRADYLPRLHNTASAAGAAAAAAAQAATSEINTGITNVAAAVSPQPVVKKKCTVGKTLLIVGIVTAAAAAGYVAWRSTRPQDDPWAPPADFSRPRYPTASNNESDDESLAEAVGGAEAGDVAEALKGGEANPKA